MGSGWRDPNPWVNASNLLLTGDPDADAEDDEPEDEKDDGPGPGKLRPHARHLPAVHQHNIIKKLSSQNHLSINRTQC